MLCRSRRGGFSAAMARGFLKKTLLPSYVTRENQVARGTYSTLNIFTSWVDGLALADMHVVKTSYHPHQITYQNMQNFLSFLNIGSELGRSDYPGRYSSPPGPSIHASVKC